MRKKYRLKALNQVFRIALTREDDALKLVELFKKYYQSETFSSYNAYGRGKEKVFGHILFFKDGGRTFFSFVYFPAMDENGKKTNTRFYEKLPSEIKEFILSLLTTKDKPKLLLFLEFD